MHMTTASNENAKQSMVISNTSDIDTLPSDNESIFFMDDNSDSNNPKDTDTTTTKKTGTPSLGFLDYPPSQNIPEPNHILEPTTKVEVQGSHKSFIPVSPHAPHSPTACKMEVEIDSISSRSNHSGGAQLQPHEDAPQLPSAARKTTLIPSVCATPPNRESHVRQSQCLLYNSLAYVYDPMRTVFEESKDNQGDGDDSGDDPESNIAIGSPSAERSSWDAHGEHPGMGWSMNDPLASHYYPFLIPDPTTAVYHPITAPYIMFSILPYQAEVSTTYGRDYPIYTRALTPTPVNYVCSSISHEQLTLLMQPPFDEAIAAVVENHFPITLDATFKRYKYFQEKKYQAQDKIWELQLRLDQTCNNENSALEKAICVLSEMENANFMGRLFCYEDDILHHLSSHPHNAHAFLKHALNFEGPITQSGLNPTPNPHRRVPTSHNPRRLTSHQLHAAAAAEAIRLMRNYPTPIHKTLSRPCCFKCKKHGHVIRDCPKKLHRL